MARRSNAALNRGDLDGALEAFAPHAKLRDLAHAPDQSVVVDGVEAIRAAWGQWIGAFDELQAAVSEWIDEGDAVVAATHWRGTGRGSGISIDIHQFDVFEVREGKIIQATLGYTSRSSALKAAGVSE